MQRAKIGMVLMTMFGILLGTSSIAIAKAALVNHTKVSHISTKIAHHPTKSHASKKYASKSVIAIKSVKTAKLSKSKLKTNQSLPMRRV